MSITEQEQVSPTQKVQLVSLALHLAYKGGCREGNDQSENREKPWNSKPLNKRKLSLNVCLALDVCFP